MSTPLKISDSDIIISESNKKSQEKFSESENVKENVSTTEDSDNEKHSLFDNTKDKEAVMQSAGNILRQNRSAYGKEALAGQLAEIRQSVRRGEWSEAMRTAKEAAAAVMEQSRISAEISADAKEILGMIRTTRISLTPEQKAEVAASHDGYGNFRSSNMGKILITNDGLSLEKQWPEWAEEYPAVFDAETVAEDMPGEPERIVNTLRSSYGEYDGRGLCNSNNPASAADKYFSVPRVK